MTNDILTQVPEHYCIMPKMLTAGNGAKGALMGEFYIEHFVRCTECDGEGSEEEPCEACDNQGGQTVKTYIDWTTIKDIYRMAVEVCSIPPVPAPDDVELQAQLAASHIMELIKRPGAHYSVYDLKSIITAAVKGEM